MSLSFLILLVGCVALIGIVAVLIYLFLRERDA